MTEETPQQNNPLLALRGQYIKDLSFENPRAPQSLMELKEPPKIDIKLDLNAARLQETLFELAISISCRAQADKNTVFLVDMTYAGIFEVQNIPEEHLRQVVMVDCAFILFPFARRVIADITRDGGFPPLQLEPVDFHGMFQQNAQEEKASL